MKYPDNKGKKIRKGFYRYPSSDRLIYFTGRYNEETGFPIFEKEGENENEREFPDYVVRRLSRVSDKEVTKGLESIADKEKALWIDKKLKE